MTEKIQDVATGAKIRSTTNNIIDDSISTISITDGNLKVIKANNTSSSISIPANLKLTTTVSTQKGTSHYATGSTYGANVDYADGSNVLNAYIGTSATLTAANGVATSYNSGVAKPTSTTLNAQKKSTISVTDTFKTVTGLAAGTYTLQSLLQQLVNRSHTHTLDRTMSVSNCRCNCYGDYCSSSS
jgi:hypothetical protein